MDYMYSHREEHSSHVLSSYLIDGSGNPELDPFGQIELCNLAATEPDDVTVARACTLALLPQPQRRWRGTHAHRAALPYLVPRGAARWPHIMRWVWCTEV